MTHRKQKTKIKEKEWIEREDKCSDPLTWFGALPLSSTREAQKDFKGFLNIIVEIANVLKKIRALEEIVATERC